MQICCRLFIKTLTTNPNYVSKTINKIIDFNKVFNAYFSTKTLSYFEALVFKLREMEALLKAKHNAQRTYEQYFRIKTN